MKLAGKTDVGRVRQDNQDDYRAGELPGDAAWLLVCDGMGGARGGREASQSACDVIERCFQEQYASKCLPGEEETFLKKTLLSANRFVFQKALREEELAGIIPEMNKKSNKKEVKRKTVNREDIVKKLSDALGVTFSQYPSTPGLYKPDVKPETFHLGVTRSHLSVYIKNSETIKLSYNDDYLSKITKILR